MSEPAVPAAPPVVFDCEGCGVHVQQFGIDRMPVHTLCMLCAWLCEEVPDPEEMMRLRRLFWGADHLSRARERRLHGGLG